MMNNSILSDEQNELYEQIWTYTETVLDNNFIGGDNNLTCSAPHGTFNDDGFVNRTKFPYTVKFSSDDSHFNWREVPHVSRGQITIERVLCYSLPNEAMKWLFMNIPCDQFTYRESRDGAYLHFSKDDDMALFRLVFNCTVTMNPTLEQASNA